MTYKIIAISGSLRKGSKNTALMNAAIGLNKSADIVVEEYDISNIPLYNQDLEVGEGDVKTFPDAVTTLREAVSAAHGLIFVTPEHNFLMSAAMKNIIDWLSRGTVLAGKVVGLMSAAGATGGSSATGAMKNIFEKLTWLNIAVISPQVNVRLFDGVQKFNERNELVHEQTITDINSVYNEIAKLIGKN
jgi:chromate reductase